MGSTNRNLIYCMVVMKLIFLSSQDNLSIKLRPVGENDIEVLYEMLKEMLTTLNASVNERPLPPYEDSKKYVMKYLHDNENHEIDNWYIIIDENNTVLGSTKISNKNYVSYQVLKKFQNKGLGTSAVKLLMEKHSRDRYFATINRDNDPSMKLIEKLGFKPKATVFEKIVE